MADENRYSLEDIKDLLKRRDSPFKVYKHYDDGARFVGFEKTGFGEDRNGIYAVLLLGLQEYDEIVKFLVYKNTREPRCTEALMRAFLKDDLEDLPAYIGRHAPPYIEERTINLGKCCLHHRECQRCLWVAKWRLERGK